MKDKCFCHPSLISFCLEIFIARITNNQIDASFTEFEKLIVTLLQYSGIFLWVKRIQEFIFGGRVQDN